MFSRGHLSAVYNVNCSCPILTGRYLVQAGTLLRPSKQSKHLIQFGLYIQQFQQMPTGLYKCVKPAWIRSKQAKQLDLCIATLLKHALTRTRFPLTGLAIEASSMIMYENSEISVNK